MTSRRTLMIALFVSLAANLFSVGLLVGGYLAGPRGTPPHAARVLGLGPGPGPGAMLSAAAALSPEQRDAFRESWRAQAREARPRLREARQVRREAYQRFVREPFDASAALTDLDRARRLELEGRALADRQLVEFAATLPAADRIRFGKALAAPRASGRRGPDPGGRHGGPPALSDR